MRLVVFALSLTLAACGSSELGGDEEAAADASADKEEAARPAAGEAPTPTPTFEAWKLPEGHNPALLDPSLAQETAPSTYKAKFETTKGDFVVQVHRDWAPAGADRFYNLVKIGFYEKAAFFRTIDGFMSQFGISGYPEVSAVWREAKIQDDPVRESNTRGRVTFATAGPNTRTTQLFVNYRDGNARLDQSGFAPFGEVVEGMDVVDSLHKTGEGHPAGPGPSQGLLQSRGGAYVEAKFPKIDSIKKVTIVE